MHDGIKTWEMRNGDQFRHVAEALATLYTDEGYWEKIARQHCTDLEAISLLCEELCRLYFDDYDDNQFDYEMSKLRRMVGMD